MQSGIQPRHKAMLNAQCVGSPALHAGIRTSDQPKKSGRNERNKAVVHAVARQSINCDVAITGGGLAGLITAHALRRAIPEIDVKVFEQFPSTKKAGALLGVAPNSQKVLHAIDANLLEQAKLVSIRTGKSIVYSHKGEVLKEGNTGDAVAVARQEESEEQRNSPWKSYLRLGWWELHQTIAAVQPQGTVFFDSKFAGYNESDDRVSVFFDSASKDGAGTEVSAKLLVGADGAFSGVRRQCLDDGNPTASRTVIWRARLPAGEMGDLLEAGVAERVFTGDQRYASVWLVSDDPREGSWVCGTNKDVLSKLGVDFDAAPGARTGYQVLPIGKTAHQRVMKVMEGYPKQLTDLIAATDPDLVAEHGMWTRTVTGGWGKGLVTLVGDAAHPVRPASGQGFGQAAEDAHALATALRDGGLNQESLRSFEAGRWPRVAHIGATEQALAESSYSKTTDKAQIALMGSEYQKFLLSLDLAPL